MFPGQYEDLDTEGAGVTLSHNWHRTYDPTLGRYLQSDPIGLAGGLNRYAYVGGNPMNYTDSKGLNPGIDRRADAAASLGRSYDKKGFLHAYNLGDKFQRKYLGEQHNHLDAARHSEWNKAMQEECHSGVAWAMGTANEIRGYVNPNKNIAAARYMDLHNNREGRRAAREGRAINPRNLILRAMGSRSSARANRERYKCDCDDTQFSPTMLRGPSQSSGNHNANPSYYEDVRTYK